MPLNWPRQNLTCTEGSFLLNVLTVKLKEVLPAVLPITVIVTILNLTITPFGTDLYIRFTVGAFLIVVGLTLFLLGVDIGITQIGNLMGSSIAKTNRLPVVIAAGLVLGFVISVAEPDLHILAQQVKNVTAGSIDKTDIVLVVSTGIALMLALGFIRILYNIAANKIFTALYLSSFSRLFHAGRIYGYSLWTPQGRPPVL